MLFPPSSSRSSFSSRLLTYRNLTITMVLGGLWHGVVWPFALWGAFHGLGLVAEHALGGRVRVPGRSACSRASTVSARRSSAPALRS